MTGSILSITWGASILLIFLLRRYIFPSRISYFGFIQILLSMVFCAIALYKLLTDIMSYQVSELQLSQIDLLDNLCHVLVILLGILVLNDTILAMNIQPINEPNNKQAGMVNKQSILGLLCIAMGMINYYLHLA